MYNANISYLRVTKPHINIMFFFKQDGFAKSNQLRKQDHDHNYGAVLETFVFWFLTLTQLFDLFFWLTMESLSTYQGTNVCISTL